jgi:hypothetical protein
MTSKQNLINYNTKYLKYKKKYLSFKNMIAGTNLNEYDRDVAFRLKNYPWSAERTVYEAEVDPSGKSILDPHGRLMLKTKLDSSGNPLKEQCKYVASINDYPSNTSIEYIFKMAEERKDEIEELKELIKTKQIEYDDMLIAQHSKNPERLEALKFQKINFLEIDKLNKDLQKLKEEKKLEEELEIKSEEKLALLNSKIEEINNIIFIKNNDPSIEKYRQISIEYNKKNDEIYQKKMSLNRLIGSKYRLSPFYEGGFIYRGIERFPINFNPTFSEYIKEFTEKNGISAPVFEKTKKLNCKNNLLLDDDMMSNAEFIHTSTNINISIDFIRSTFTSLGGILMIFHINKNIGLQLYTINEHGSFDNGEQEVAIPGMLNIEDTIVFFNIDKMTINQCWINPMYFNEIVCSESCSCKNKAQIINRDYIFNLILTIMKHLNPINLEYNRGLASKMQNLIDRTPPSNDTIYEYPIAEQIVAGFNIDPK